MDNMVLPLKRLNYCPILNINIDQSLLIKFDKSLFLAISLHLTQSSSWLINLILGLICLYPPVIWASSGFRPCKKKSLDFNLVI